MASNEVLSLLEYVEQERGIDKNELIRALEKSLVSAIRKTVSYGKDLTVRVDPSTGKIQAWADYEVVNDKTRADKINIEEAKEQNPDVEIGDTVTVEIPQSVFGRIAAQTAKQTMLQQLKKAEKARAYEEFKDSIGKIISGKVRRYEGSNIILDFQKAEGVLSAKDKLPSDRYAVGERLNSLLVDINTVGSGPSLILSRTNRKFLRLLLEREVAEISEGIVEIKGIVRDPGSRAKIAVVSHDSRVDPIGACIGMRGSRIKNITTELNGEKIDVVRYDENETQYIVNAMQPAIPKRIDLDKENNTVNVYVDQSQIRLAIGKSWQNVKLCSQLIGMKVNVISIENQDKTFEDKIKETVKALSDQLDVSVELAGKLVNNGILTQEGLEATSRQDLLNFEGITEEELKELNK